MIKIWYDVRWQSTRAIYKGVLVEIKDGVKVSKAHKELFRKVDETGISTGIDCADVPYTQELWDALLAVGERVG